MEKGTLMPDGGGTATLSPDNPLSSLHAYIEHCALLAGSNQALGYRLGLSGGGRVGMWSAGRGRPSELNCMQLADFSGHDMIDILRLAGYDEMADLVAKRVKGTPPNTEVYKDKLVLQLDAVADMAERIKSLLEKP